MLWKFWWKGRHTSTLHTLAVISTLRSWPTHPLVLNSKLIFHWCIIIWEENFARLTKQGHFRNTSNPANNQQPANISMLLLGWYEVMTFDNVKSTLKFTTLNNVASALYISMLILTTLDNVETTLSFSTSGFTTLTKTEATFRL